MGKNLSDIFKVSLSVLLGGAILWWMYRDFNLASVSDVMLHRMDWTWMLLSFPFGIMAQVFRGLRWRQSLEPVGERPRISTCINAVFLSYATSLLIPRMGEFARCGVLKRYDGTSFPKALGTVVTERIVDSLLIVVITVATLLWQARAFNAFFRQTDTSIDTLLRSFTTTGYVVTAVCGIAVVVLLWYLLSRLSIYDKVKDSLNGVWQGIRSLEKVHNLPLFATYSLAIWASYFLHYYLTFFSFDATSRLSISCALVTFIVGSIAVIVPTPNGAGPWHFAVKTMLILYTVPSDDALYFVLIVHAVQTLLVAALGIYAWTMLAMTRRRQQATTA